MVPVGVLENLSDSMYMYSQAITLVEKEKKYVLNIHYFESSFSVVVTSFSVFLRHVYRDFN